MLAVSNSEALIGVQAQASKVDQIEMNLGFDYENTFIIRFSEDLDEFYKKWNQLSLAYKPIICW